MTKDETVRLLDWLGNIYPRQYSPNMTQRRREDLLNTFYQVFSKHSLIDIQDACMAILREEDEAPTVKSIMARIRSNAAGSRSTERPLLDLEAYPPDHPYRGCYYHDEALDAYQRDNKAGRLYGRSFSDYCMAYPHIAWRPWANPELNRDRIDDPAGEWHYMKGKPFGGWKTNGRGFCVPVPAQPGN